jgi:hypothetical protein
MAVIRRIGIPENDSESRAIKQLSGGLSDDYIVFHNFELISGKGTQKGLNCMEKDKWKVLK